MIRPFCITACFTFLFLCASAQEIYQNQQVGVYAFLDEMTNLKLIELNTAVQPYSRVLIASKLNELDKLRDQLNSRQTDELDFFLKDYGKELHADKSFERRRDLFYYKDSVFAITVNPILGFTIYNNHNGLEYQRWNGGEFWSYLGERVSAYASLRDNGVSEILAEYNYLTLMQGASYKLNQGQTGGRSDYSEMKGGISYGWDWGSVALLKENFRWGNAYHGANIFSSRNPSFAYLQLKLHPTKWLDFNYIHGWLASELLDSARTYLAPSGKRKVNTNKNLAANFFTVRPFEGLYFSFGNSVIYSDDGVQPAFLIPFLFYKSVDHTYNGTGSNELGQNAQMFFDLSVRKWKKVHTYASLFLDEISISNIFDKAEHTNLYSLKVGTKVSQILNNVSMVIEYTRTNPWTYRHQIPSTTFESNQFTLGHYLRDNTQEIFGSIIFKPLRGLRAELSYWKSQKGPEVEFAIVNGSPNVSGLKFLEEVIWQNESVAFDLRYEIINDGFLSMGYTYSQIMGDVEPYTPAYFQGTNHTLSLGINYGF